MNVNGPQALLNLIGGDNIPSVANVRSCIQSLNKICSCQKQRKSQKAEECTNTYITFINSQSNGLTEYFKTKTNDEFIIFTHGSNHEIKRIKLR
jgi:hypothetical protein